ncbi:MAG: preprotein translocase subunit SecG [Polyangiales bacterium]
MTTFLTIVHVFACLFLVAVVLLQSGKAGGMGVLSGAQTQTVFGGRGAGGFLTKATAVCATLFMLTSASLAYISSSGRDALARGNNNDAGVADAGAADAGRDAAAEAAAPAPTPAAPAVPAATEDAAAPATGDAAAAAPTAPRRARPRPPRPLPPPRPLRLPRPRTDRASPPLHPS